MRHLFHYPRYIRMFGPLLNVWDMRFEGKHAHFKKDKKMLNNFINPPFSLTLRHQQWLTKQMTISNTTQVRSSLLNTQFLFLENN